MRLDITNYLLFDLSCAFLSIHHKEYFNLSNSQQDQEVIDNFRKSFTNKQKAAILSSMMIIASTDGTVNQGEEKHFEEMTNTLGISFDDPDFQSMLGKGRFGLAEISNTLSEGKKVWYAISIYKLLSKSLSQGLPNKKKLEIALAILSDIGISEGDFMRIIKP